MTKLDGGVTAPSGYRASGVAAHIKNLASEKLDCALVASDSDAVVAGTFTTNVVKAPPVSWTEQVCAGGTARAVFLNSGNANACTGTQGMADARATAAQVGEGLGVAAEAVAVLSTGVIGVNLPMDRIAQGVAGCLDALSTTGSHDAARAIMTTDTVPKELAVELALSGGPVRIGAMAKGSGMIAPNMATMFCIITTDAAIAPRVLRPLLRDCVSGSFNCICVDNDMSTSDAVVCFANGQSGLPELAPGTADYDAFAAALREVCLTMAHALVRDGEGATKFVEIRVDGAPSDEAAKTVARSIAQSQLCKTAFAGEDPNIGRLACAAGYAGVGFDQADLSIWLGEVQVVQDGMPAAYEEENAAAVMRQPAFAIRVSIGGGPGAAVFWTSDLSHDYVTINADYRT